MNDIKRTLRWTKQDTEKMTNLGLKKVRRKYPSIPILKAKISCGGGQDGCPKQIFLDVTKTYQTGPMTYHLERNCYIVPKRDFLKVARQLKTKTT